ncbi:MAG: hypothetical protein HQM00_16190 [Magnetococcales bacterium]|nr:hypothetical protein [Magnetococcales bacterium]
MTPRLVTGVVGLSLGWMVCEANALTMTGPMQVQSALNQPFVAEIPYGLDAGEEVPQVEVWVGSHSDFASGGEARTRLTARLVENAPPGGEKERGGRILIAGSTPESEPFFTILLRITKRDVSFVRNYAVVLDAKPTQGTTPFFPVRNGANGVESPLSDLTHKPWAIWRGWVSGMSREMVAGISGVGALLLLGLLRWVRRRTEGASPSSTAEGLPVRREPVAVSDSEGFAPTGEARLRQAALEPSAIGAAAAAAAAAVGSAIETESDPAIDAEMESVGFVVSDRPVTVATPFAPNPLGELPAAAPEPPETESSSGEKSDSPETEQECLAALHDSAPVAPSLIGMALPRRPSLSAAVTPREEEELAAFVAFSGDGSDENWKSEAGASPPDPDHDESAALLDLEVPDFWSLTPEEKGEASESKTDPASGKEPEKTADPIEVLSFSFITDEESTSSSSSARAPEVKSRPEAAESASAWAFVPFDLDEGATPGGDRVKR